MPLEWCFISIFLFFFNLLICWIHFCCQNHLSLEYHQVRWYIRLCLDLYMHPIPLPGLVIYYRRRGRDLHISCGRTQSELPIEFGQAQLHSFVTFFDSLSFKIASSQSSAVGCWIYKPYELPAEFGLMFNSVYLSKVSIQDVFNFW